GLEGRGVAVNLSGHSIGDDGVLVAVRAAVEEGLDPSSLAFEITETAAVRDLAAARAFTRELTDLGCDVALDDFGTGFGSFTHLKHLSTAYLKIDMEFVQNVAHSEVDRRVVAAIVETAHSLGKLAVAEGVEDEATLEALRAL